MKNIRKVILVAAVLFFSLSVNGQTNVSGFISANTTWTVAGSPYIVVGNALLSNGYTLTINPGVMVKFNLNTALQVDGEIIAIGTPQNRITFTSNKALPQPGDWGKLHIADNSTNAVYDANGKYLSGSILKYCDVLYAGGVSFGAIHIESASPYISQCNVKYSKAAGIYCVGSAYLLDSSLVSDCDNHGLYFDQIRLNSCGLNIQNDSIKNNKWGGLFVNNSPGCSTIVKNNYFFANARDGAIWITDVQNLTFTDNYFFANTATATARYPGIVTLQNLQNSLISRNIFERDSIKGNYGSHTGILTVTNSSSAYDTIECNIFLNNSSAGNGISAIFLAIGGSNEIIQNNIIDGNSNNSAGGYAAVFIDCNSSNAIVKFTNNIIRNNSAPLSSCCYFWPYLPTINPQLFIDHNTFENNMGKEVLLLTGNLTNNSNYNFLYMKHNNFLDANTIELYNKIPYGSPNVSADSNYWGSTNPLHIDSIIYDYFDTANYSVVYYAPVLTSPAFIDTSCSLGIPTSVAGVKKNTDASSKPFPNPFSVYTEIIFNDELKDALLSLYNIFGQKVRAIEHINGNRISIWKEYLPEGVYVYNVVEKERVITSGKIMVQ